MARSLLPRDANTGGPIHNPFIPAKAESSTQSMQANRLLVPRLPPSRSALRRTETRRSSRSERRLGRRDERRRRWLDFERHARDGLEVAMPDFFLVRFGHVDALKDAQRFACVHRALLGIERAVRREYDLVEIVKRQARIGRRHAADHGGVGIERVLEIIQRTLFELLQDDAQVFVGGAGAELVPAWTNAAFQHGYDAAEMVRNDFQVRVFVHDLGEYQPRHGSRGLVGPSE